MCVCIWWTLVWNSLYRICAANIYRPHTKFGGKVMFFTTCLSVRGRGGSASREVCIQWGSASKGGLHSGRSASRDSWSASRGSAFRGIGQIPPQSASMGVGQTRLPRYCGIQSSGYSPTGMPKRQFGLMSQGLLGICCSIETRDHIEIITITAVLFEQPLWAFIAQISYHSY